MTKPRSLVDTIFAGTVVITIVAQLLAGFIAPAAAVGSCTGSGSNYFAGYLCYSRAPVGWKETPEGASGYIVTRPGHVCTNLNYPFQFSTAWVMIADQVFERYAQSGYMYINTSGCNRYFTEYNRDDGTGFHRALSGGCAIDNQRHPYYAQCIGPAGPYPPCCGSMRLDAYGLITFPQFDPWHDGWSFTPEYFGEVTHLANDVPGSVSAPANMSAMGIQAVSSGSFVTVPCYLAHSVTGSRYYATASSCHDIAIYRNPL